MTLRLAALVSAGLVCSAAPVAAGSAGDVAAALAGLAPHRATYEMRLIEADRNADLAGLDGRLIYALSGDVCDGHSVTFRYVSRFTTREGRQAVTDVRASTHETYGDDASGGRFRFLTRTLVDAETSDEARGLAVREAGAPVSVSLTEPEPDALDLDPATLFPTEHLARLVAAARAGERVVEALIYDGGEGGRTVSDTVAVIGKPRPKRTTGPKALQGLVSWPISLSYYEPGVSGDQTPDYTVRFDLYENGVNDALVLDYGAFQVSGTLTELAPEPSPGGC